MGNHVMTVQFFGNVVRAQTEGSRICLNDLYIAGNALRLQDGRPALQMNAFLQSKGLQDYVVAAAEEWNLPVESFIIKEGRGRNTRTFVHASVALLAAEAMSPRFHAHMHRVFIEGKLLEFRERGGTEFRALNASIDQYLLKGAASENRMAFVSVALALRNRILGPNATTESWNNAGVEQTHLRYEWEHQLCSMMRLGVVKDVPHLIELIGKL